VSGETVLDESAQTTLDGSGNGFVLLGPTNPATRWIPAYMSVTVSSNNLEPQFKFYLGNSAGPSTYKGGTNTGSNDTTDIAGIILNPGQKLYCVWTAGDPGAQASAVIGGRLLYD